MCSSSFYLLPYFFFSQMTLIGSNSEIRNEQRSRVPISLLESRMHDMRETFHLRGTSRLVNFNIRQSLNQASFDAIPMQRGVMHERVYRDSWLVTMTAGKSHRDPRYYFFSSVSYAASRDTRLCIISSRHACRSREINPSESWRSLLPIYVRF